VFNQHSANLQSKKQCLVPAHSINDECAENISGHFAEANDDDAQVRIDCFADLSEQIHLNHETIDRHLIDHDLKSSNEC
jgi:hypothetical protein